ncbi:MAG: DUF2335 domain-containing protein [Armatimonadota bacterium]
MSKDKNKIIPKSGQIDNPQTSLHASTQHDVTAEELRLVQISQQLICGPIPSADELAKYEQILPGAANRILCTYEAHTDLLGEQARHRMGLESCVVNGDGKRAWAGIIIGGIIGIGGLASAAYLGMHGHDILAGGIFLGDVGSIIGTFIYGTNSKRAERRDRLQILKKDDQE